MTGVEIGRVVKPHGLRGEVGILLHRADSSLLESLTFVTLEGNDGTATVYKVEHVARMGRGLRVKFGGCDDRTAAEKLRGATVSVPREILPPLEVGETYLADLIGAKVIDPKGDDFGVVVAVRCYPSVDSVIIDRTDGSSVEQPLVEDWVTIVMATTPTLVLSSLEGLL